MEQNVLFALFLSFLAGLASLVGGVLSFFARKNDMRFLSVGMGFSAGMMIFIAFMELLPDSIEKLSVAYPLSQAKWMAIMSFFSGISLAGAIDHLIPVHHIGCTDANCTDKSHIEKLKIKRTGIFITAAIAIHNLPAGLITFMGGLENAMLGISIAVAIGLHSIPEGLAVALPIYNATDDKKKTLLCAGLSGMATPLGALIGLLFLSSINGVFIFGFMFALVAGIMVYISLDELLPIAHRYGDGHKEILGVLAGMFIIAISLLLTNGG